MDNQNKKTKSLLDDDGIKLVESSVKNIIFYDDQKKAFEFSSLLNKAFVSNIQELKENNDIFNFYKEAIIKLKFIALPLLSENEILELLSKYFIWQFKIEYYDLIEKFKNKLLYIIVYEERDRFKASVKRMLQENDLIITREATRKTIKDWLNDYNSNLGLGVTDKLKRTQYLIDLKRIKNLEDPEIEKLKLLFNFYELLKLSSLSPAGFDEEVLIEINENLQIFDRGNLEPISGTFFKARGISGPPRTKEEKNIDELKERLPQEEGIGKMAIEEGISNEQKIDELKIMANKYKENSLQKRAIEEEIKKLEAK